MPDMLTLPDIYEKLGTLSGRFVGVEAQLNRIERTLASIDERLHDLEKVEADRRGALRAIAAVFGLIGGAASLLVQWLINRHT